MMTETLPRLSLMAQEDLKCELYELKKHLHVISSENYLFKVKVRKLQDEVNKKNKQIECLLDPRKSTNVRKIISERGATMIINLKQRNSDLEEVLLAKDAHIRKLQNTVDTSKVYATSEKRLGAEQCYRNNNNKFRSRSLSVTPVPQYGYLKANSDVQLEYARLAQNLQTIKLANNSSRSNTVTRPFSHSNVSVKTDRNEALPSVKSYLSETDSGDSDRNDVEEYLASMITEMEQMKRTITELSREQANMKQVLKDKNNNIEVLAKRVRHLQRRKYKRYSNTRSPTKVSQACCLDHGTGTQVAQKSGSTDTCTQNSFEEDSAASRNISSSTDNSSTGTETRQPAENDNDNDDDDVETGD